MKEASEKVLQSFQHFISLHGYSWLVLAGFGEES